MRDCPVCSNPVPPSRTRPHIYCSPKCRTAAWDLEHRAARLAAQAAEVAAAWERVRAARDD
jgi:endogenous inhibitor of DNA gyrase (YacG/DUF329 family)